MDSIYQSDLRGLGLSKTGFWCGKINLNFGDVTSKQQKWTSRLKVPTQVRKPLLWKPFLMQSFLLNPSPKSVELTWKRVLTLVLNSSKPNYSPARHSLELPAPGKAGAVGGKRQCRRPGSAQTHRPGRLHQEQGVLTALKHPVSVRGLHVTTGICALGEGEKKPQHLNTL